VLSAVLRNRTDTSVKRNELHTSVVEFGRLETIGNPS
jgi:hypothetical protein